MFRYLTMIAGIAFLAGCAATSQPQYTAEVVDVPEYREFLAVLEQHVEEGVPRELNEREMQRFQRLNGSLNELLAGVDDINQLSSSERTRVFNLHQELSATVVGRDEDQVICRRQQTVGTHFRVTECRTRAQIAEDRARADMYFNDSFVSPMTGPQHGG